jgi:crotonobetainyl-CoA:carnitine CoA-transferase CaiB-like acyl-CoA transferase
MSLPPHEQLPLSGIRVVDFGVYLAGPLVGRILCDAGASVTAVTPIGGPHWKHECNNVLSRGKIVVELDLKSQGGRERAMKLVAEADVVVENFSPGVMDKLGFSASRVHEINPQCIYMSLPGFASNDSQFANQKAYEAVVMAAAGVFADMGLNRQLMGVNPSYSPLPLASTYSSVIGALGVTMALLTREVTGEGDRLEVPLAAGLCDCLVYNSMDIPALPKRYASLRELEIERCQEKGLPMKYNHAQVKEMLDPFYHTYICKDGRPFYVVAVCHEIHQQRTLEALGLWEDLVAQKLPVGYDVYADSDNWGEGITCILGTYPITDPVWIVRLKTAMKAAFLQRPAEEWERIFISLKIPGGATRTTQEWINSEHAISSGLITERTWAPGGPVVREATQVVWLDRSKVPASEAQRGNGIAAARRRAFQASSRDALHDGNTTIGGMLWLKGTRVVDLANVIAGPTIGGILARFGATVIKVDPSKPTYDALVTTFMGVPANTGKMSILANIKKGAEGKELLRRLLEWADVVICNQVPSQLAALGIDEPSVKAINPHVIFTRFDAFGGPGWGPNSDAIGYDDVLQATTGIMARFGGGLSSPEEHAHLGTIDVVSGWSGALATCLALFKRIRTGQSDIARTSLASNSQLVQTPFMYDYEGRTFDEPSGPAARGEHALYRWYETSDSHVFVAAFVSPENAAALRECSASLSQHGVGGKDGLAAIPETARVDVIRAELKSRTTTAAVELLQRAGVTAVPLSSLTSLREGNRSVLTSFGLGSQRGDEANKTFHFSTQKEHPIGGEVTMFSPCSLLSQRRCVPTPTPAPKYGEHSRQVLRTLGYTETEIESLLKKGVCSDQWSIRYLPSGNPWDKANWADSHLMQSVRKGLPVTDGVSSVRAKL